jgi:hypothetical protein
VLLLGVSMAAGGVGRLLLRLVWRSPWSMDRRWLRKKMAGEEKAGMLVGVPPFPISRYLGVEIHDPYLLQLCHHSSDFNCDV